MKNLFRERATEVIEKYTAKNSITFMKDDDTEEKLSFLQVGVVLEKQEKLFCELGLVSGDRVAIIAKHSPYVVLNGFALAYAGITSVLIDASLPLEEIERLIMFADTRGIIVDADMRGKIMLGQFQNQICLEIGDFGKLTVICGEANKIITDGEEDVIAILFSSGTTGKMKGVKITYDSVIKAREIFERLAGLKDYMTYLLVLPFNHIAGYTGAMTFFLTGCGLGFIEDVNATKLHSGLKKYKPYYFAMVPKVYEVIEQQIRNAIHEKGKFVESLVLLLLKLSGFLRRHLGINVGRKVFKNIIEEVFGENIFGIGTGASPCKESTTEFYLNLGLEWANLYATTETGVPITATGVADRYPIGTVGNVKRHPEIQVRIKEPDEKGCGEVQVKSALMMKGYFREPKLTESAFDAGYFKTGDYGYIDCCGNLHITGRIKESIILQNGKKVSPVDVDEYYMSRCPNVVLASRGVAICDGREDEIHLFVEEPSGDVVIRNKWKDELLEISRTAPEMYHCKRIHFVENIPVTSVGKVKRYLLISEEEKEKQNLVTEIGGVAEEDKKERLINLVRKYSECKVVNADSLLKEELGVDSLSMFELVGAIEREFGKDISESLGEVEKVGDLLNVICTPYIDESQKKDLNEYPAEKDEKTIRKLKKLIHCARIIWKFRIVGEENIPKEGNYLICSNHYSNLDPIWILAAMQNEMPDLKQICCLAARHTMEGRFSQHIFAMLGGIPVEREGNTIPALNRAKECLIQGYNVIIFPEGARSRDGSMLPVKGGFAKLAIESGKAIVPVRINGGFEVFPRGRRFPRLFKWRNFGRYPLEIRFGRPILPEGKTVGTITDEWKETIERMT